MELKKLVWTNGNEYLKFNPHFGEKFMNGKIDNFVFVKTSSKEEALIVNCEECAIGTFFDKEFFLEEF